MSNKHNTMSVHANSDTDVFEFNDLKITVSDNEFIIRSKHIINIMKYENIRKIQLIEGSNAQIYLLVYMFFYKEDPYEYFSETSFSWDNYKYNQVVDSIFRRYTNFLDKRPQITDIIQRLDRIENALLYAPPIEGGGKVYKEALKQFESDKNK